MNYWLIKSEPDAFSIDDLAARGAAGEPWDGVRNYQARNFMWHDMQIGDQVLFYHSSCKDVGVAGLAEVLSDAMPDPAQFDPESRYFDPKATAEKPRWYLRRFGFVRKFAHVVPLATLRAYPDLQQMMLLQRSRLSITPVRPEEWRIITELGLNQRPD
ncbi:EVE domain-containing protein [Salinispirillum marinum]|uniref:EVE domain-containing protein n=2 Tax=Saccharospirillaceae TaxID=255527 RepID=A0ABV8BDW4_9GAMM